MNIEKFGLYIQRRRKELNMTQQELADLVGVTNKAVSKWERGQSIPDIALFKSISTHLDIEMIDLLSAGDLQDSKQIEKKEVSTLMEKAIKAVQSINLRKVIEIVYFIIMVGCGMGLFITILVDFLLNGTITWSGISTAAILGAMIIVTIIRLTYTNPVNCFFGVIFGGLLISIPIVYSVGVYVSELVWFKSYFVYFVLGGFLSVVLAFIYFKVSKQSFWIKVHISVIIVDFVNTLIQILVTKSLLIMIPNIAGLIVLLLTLPVTINYSKNKELL